MTPDDLLKIVATPSRLGVYLAPLVWGDGQTYDVDPWLELMEQRVLDAFLDRSTQRFIRCHMPPQIGKTSYSGGFLPFWVLGMFPETRIILVTYSDDYSRLRGGETRDLVKAYGHKLFGINVDPDKEAAGDWRLKGHRGGMLSVGIGSQITGRSGDLIIIDDVIKNIQEAASVVTKDLHRKEYRSTIRPRLQPGGTILMTSTRWAEDDLAGSIEMRENSENYKGERYEVLSFPAIAEPADDETVEDEATWRDILGREMGQPLQCRFTDPDKPWEETIFYNLRDSSDDFLEFSCVFQQKPVAGEGGMFPPTKWQYYRSDEVPEMRAVCRVWDPAATEGGGDWSVGLKMGRGQDGNYYILDVWRGRVSADLVLATAKQIATGVDGSICEVGVERERAGGGKTTVQFWTIELNREGIRVFECPADDTKEDRARPASTFQQSGHLKLPHPEEGKEWVPQLIDQARRMMGDGRRGRYDDMVDTMAYAVRHLMPREAVDFWDPSAAEFSGATQEDVEGWILQHVRGVRVA